MILMDNNIEKEEKKSYEILNEQKESILNTIKENPELLNKQLLIPELIYPNLKRYEVENGLNNIILSITAAEKGYADNTWIIQDTIKNSKYIDEKGEEKQSFFLKKDEKATKIEKMVTSVKEQDPETGHYYDKKLDKPYKEYINVYNLSQFSFAKDTYPKNTSYENEKKESIKLKKEMMEKLSENKIEAKIEKFFIEQKYNIKDIEKIKPIEKESFVADIESRIGKEGKEWTDSYKIERFSGIAKSDMKKDLENLIIKSRKKVDFRSKNNDKELER